MQGESYTYIMHLHTCMLSCFSHVPLFATLWTIAHQAPLSMGMLQVRTAGVGCCALLQGIFQTQDQIGISYISCIGRQVLYQ